MQDCYEYNRVWKQATSPELKEVAQKGQDGQNLM